MGYVRVGGARAWERSEAGGVDDNDRHLRHSRSRVPRRSSGRIKEERRQWKTREDQAWILVCVLCAAVVREGCRFTLCLLISLLNFECSPVPASFFPIYELCYTCILLKLLFYFILLYQVPNDKWTLTNSSSSCACEGNGSFIWVCGEVINSGSSFL